MNTTSVLLQQSCVLTTTDRLQLFDVNGLQIILGITKITSNLTPTLSPNTVFIGQETKLFFRKGVDLRL